MYSEVYYKILYRPKHDHITIVCMQDFDEYDYDHDNFLKDKDGDELKFDLESSAIKWLNDNIKRDKIDPEYRNPNYQNFSGYYIDK